MIDHNTCWPTIMMICKDSEHFMVDHNEILMLHCAQFCLLQG